MTPRQRGLAATATCAMLVPALLNGALGVDWLPVSARSALSAVPPGVGDVLNALSAGSGSGADTFGVGGKLPRTDALGADLIADADDASAFGDYLPTGVDGLPTGPLGVPGVMLDAYTRAEQRLAQTTPGCKIHWSLLAGIGRIESGHARGGRVDARGNAVPAILGPVLNGGPGIAAIRDTDGGRYDGDTTWDRAVGPMQFIPSTWQGYAADGNGDGERNPNNVYDATVGAGNYLCAYGSDLSDPAQRAKSVFRYNHSEEYVRTVLYWADAYRNGVTLLPDLAGSDEDFTPIAPPGNSGGTGSGNQGSGNGQSGGSSTSTTTTTTTTDGSSVPSSSGSGKPLPDVPSVPMSSRPSVPPSSGSSVPPTGGECPSAPVVTTTTETSPSEPVTVTTTTEVPPGCESASATNGTKAKPSVESALPQGSAVPMTTA